MIYTKAIKKLNNIKKHVTYLSLLLSGRHRHVRIPGKVYSGIGVVLYRRNLSFPPIKKCVIEGLYGPPSPLSWQKFFPSTNCWEGGHIPPHSLSRTKARYSRRRRMSIK
jgi:hypothetical protein